MRRERGRRIVHPLFIRRKAVATLDGMTLDEETRHLTIVEAELRREFPNVPAFSVREAIEIERKTFDRARVRDFVPLLVTREVRYRLRHHVLDSETLLLGD